jgi:hypothetical protein
MRKLLLSCSLLAVLSFSSVAVAAPVKAIIKSADPASSTSATLRISKGSDSGLKLGTKGYLVDDSGARVPGSDFTVTKVEAKRCEASVNLSAKQIIDGGYGAVIEVE